MASIRKRGSSWQAQERRAGAPSLIKSFETKAHATAWARQQEAAIDRAELPITLRGTKGLTVADLLTRYEEEVTPSKKGARFERSRLKLLRLSFLGPIAATKVSPPHIARYRDERLKTVKPSSVRRELVVLRHCFEVAQREWGAPLAANPVRQIAVPEEGPSRSRRLGAGDESSVMAAAAASRAWYLQPLITLAVETGMRRGELLSVCWRDIDLQARTALLRHTKNGCERTVPLSPAAITVLRQLPRRDERVFPVKANAVRLAWERLRARAGLGGLRFHDLRHEAVSRLFEKGLNVPEVAMISGHRDPRMLFRYTHPKAESVALKLATAAMANHRPEEVAGP